MTDLFAGFHTLHGSSVEVFWYDCPADTAHPQGWYWWFCEQKRIPTSSGFGPFNTAYAAYENAGGGNGIAAAV